MGLGKVSVRGAGYSSSSGKAYMFPTARSTVKTGQPITFRREEARVVRRAEPVRPRYEAGEEVGRRDRDIGGRPPTRQLSPKDAVGLELPAKPVTPPDQSSRFDSTWSFSVRTHKDTPTRLSQPRLDSRRTSNSSLRKSNARDYTPVQAWTDPRLDFPIVINSLPPKPSKAVPVLPVGNHRARSAAPSHPLKPAPDLRSSLGTDFLSLFK